MTMHALTLTRPWCWAILHAGKDVENRSWPLPKACTGVPIALHSGKGFLPHNSRPAPLIHQGDAPREYDEPEDNRMPWAASRIVGVVWFSGHNVFPSRWRDGSRYAWDIARAFALPEPIEDVRGRQRFWMLPPDVEAKVRAQLEQEPPRG